MTSLLKKLQKFPSYRTRIHCTVILGFAYLFFTILAANPGYCREKQATKIIAVEENTQIELTFLWLELKKTILKSAKINMRGPTYRYNTETCRYERPGVSWWNLFSYSTALLITSVLMLAGLLALHDFIIDSDKEKALRKENHALQKSQTILASQLSEVESTMKVLREKDNRLHNKFFASVSPVDKESRPDANRQQILLSGGHQLVEEMKEQSEQLIFHADSTSKFYSNKLKVRYYLDLIPSLPVGHPVADLKPGMIRSGFGVRINPYHKGLYQHEGIDIVVARGTPVLATASGQVVNVKFSPIQAGFGNYIEIDHGRGFMTRYAHLEDIQVRKGDRVTKGAAIATTGNSGGSVAPHLHYEIIRSGRNVDPVQYMIQGVSSLEYEKFRVACSKENQSLD